MQHNQKVNLPRQLGLAGFYTINQDFFETDELKNRIEKIVRNISNINPDHSLIRALLNQTPEKITEHHIQMIHLFCGNLETALIFRINGIASATGVERVKKHVVEEKHPENKQFQKKEDLIQFWMERCVEYLNGIDVRAADEIKVEFFRFISLATDGLPKRDYGEIRSAIDAIVTNRSEEEKPQKINSPDKRIRLLTILSENELIFLDKNPQAQYDFIDGLDLYKEQLSFNEPIKLYIGCGNHAVDLSKIRERFKDEVFYGEALNKKASDYLMDRVRQFIVPVFPSIGSCAICNHGSIEDGFSINLNGNECPDGIANILEEEEDLNKFLNWYLPHAADHPLILVDHTSFGLLLPSKGEKQHCESGFLLGSLAEQIEVYYPVMNQLELNGMRSMGFYLTNPDQGLFYLFKKTS